MGKYDIDGIEVSLPGIPADRMIFEGIDPAARPQFAVGEVARCFFCKTPYCIRKWDWLGQYDIGDEKFVARRTPKGMRTYGLPDIERMTHGLLYNGLLSGLQASHTLLICANVGRLYRVIKEWD